MIKVIFMGTPDFAMPSLEYLHKNTNLVAIFTKEDKLNARGNKVIYSPVKKFALDNNIECIQPKTLKSDDIKEKLEDIKPDLIVVAAYGKIIPKYIIDMPKLGIINVHSSLLPKYRGASPIQASLLNGDLKTGITIMEIDEGLDTGDILDTIETEIEDSDNLETLTNRLSKIAVKPLNRVINNLINGNQIRIKQDDSKASLVKPIKKEQALIDFNDTKENIFNLVRAFNPKPVAYTTLNNERVKIFEIIKSDEKYESIAKVERIDKKGPVISVKNGSIILTKLQFENKKLSSGIDAINGRKIQLGDEFGG